MKAMRLIDTELTNACNTTCIFCPREKTPRQGFMDFRTFKEVVKRSEKQEKIKTINFCGLGEPLLNQNIVDCVEYLSQNKIVSRIQTNGSLLSKNLSKQLVHAGLNSIGFSVSGINETYNKIHNLEFSITLENIVNFMEISNGNCEIILSITFCDPIKNEIKKLKTFWNKIGIKKFFFLNHNNRGGSIDAGFNFINSDKFYAEAESLLADITPTPVCPTPFLFVFVGWDGNYYMCCNDYEKKFSLGNVFEHSINQIDIKKRDMLMTDPEVCKNCDKNPINIIREALLKIEMKTATKAELDHAIKVIKIQSDIVTP